ncbi:MAG: helix-turn-helix domain-containing protein [Verrucomicrobiota bacterium]|nr:helix-turn-helix domain-containing protein [Verrucomicrobiota bacterium]
MDEKVKEYQLLFAKTHRHPALEIVKIDFQDSMELHRHAFEELVIILNGYGVHFTDKNEYKIEKGDVFVIHPSEAHGYRNVNKLELVNILYDAKHYSSFLDGLNALPGYHTLFKIEPKMRAKYDKFKNLQLSSNAVKYVRTITQSIDEELKYRSAGYKYMADIAFFQLAGFLARRFSKIDWNKSYNLHNLSMVLAYIEENYKKEISLNNLAEIANMSISSLSRLFKKTMNKTPVKYLVEFRINKAKELLEKNKMQITETAFATGFTDSNYFSRQFKQITGISPRKWKDRIHGARNTLYIEVTE